MFPTYETRDLKTHLRSSFRKPNFFPMLDRRENIGEANTFWDVLFCPELGFRSHIRTVVIAEALDSGRSPCRAVVPVGPSLRPDGVGGSSHAMRS